MMGGTGVSVWPRGVVTEFSKLRRAFEKRQRKTTRKAAQNLAALLANGDAPPEHRPHKFLTVKQVAALLQVSTKCVYQHVDEWPFIHRIPGSTQYRGHADEIDDWLRKQPAGKRVRA